MRSNGRMGIYVINLRDRSKASVKAGARENQQTSGIQEDERTKVELENKLAVVRCQSVKAFRNCLSFKRKERAREPEWTNKKGKVALEEVDRCRSVVQEIDSLRAV